ncbi:MAG: beta strand repeat-containing protein [Akkermansia sp.]
MTIGSGRTLDEGIVSVDGGGLKVSGSGTYVLDVPSDAVSALSLKAGVSLADDWTGTVWLGSGMKLTGATLENVVKDNSTVTFNGVSGYLATGARTFSQNIVLVDDGGIPALSFNNGNDGDSRTFSGSISGSGTWVRTKTGSGNAGTKQTYRFTGNVGGWTGLFDNQVDQTTNVEFSGNATEMNVALRNSGSGTLDLSTAGESEKAFHAGVEVSSVTLAGGAVSFTSNVSTTGNFSAESAVTFGDKASIGGTLSGIGGTSSGSGETLSVSGAVTVASTGKLSVTGAATLSALTLEAGASAKFSGAVTVSGTMSVAGGATLALSSAVALGETGSLTLAAGSRTVVSGWTEGSYDTEGKVWTDGKAPEPSVSGIVTQGYKGGALYTVNADRTDAVRIADGAYFMKDGASFLYSTSDSSNNRIVLSETTENGVTTFTVGIIEACFYDVVAGDTKSLTEDVAKSPKKADYVYINDGGTLTDVSNDTIEQYGISAASGGVVGGGTIAVESGKTLTDGGALSTFTGTVSVGAGSTFATDGSVSRRVNITGGTYHATDSQTLSGVTFTNSDSGDVSKLDVEGGKSVVLTELITSDNSLEKLGEGTLTIKDTQSSSDGRKNLIAGNLTITEGEVVISTFHRSGSGGDNRGVVGGTITMEGGTVLTLQGIDCLGNASSATGKITLETGTADALTTINFARNGTDATETQHVTLSTRIEMMGNTLMTGISMNAFGKDTGDGDSGKGSVIYAEGTNNTIQNTFKLRENAYFDVKADGELTLSGNIEMYDASSTSKFLVKQGAGTLIFSGEDATLYSMKITAGSVVFAGLTHFESTNDNSLQMSNGTEFRVRDGGMFVHGGWNYENSDGTTDAGVVSASGAVNTKPLLSDDVTISGMKLTKTGDAEGTVSAHLDGVQLIQRSAGALTIGNATDGQHLTSLTVERGSVVLNTATVDSATVREGASLTLKDGQSVTLGSTITNMGSVTLAGNIIVENVEGLRPAGEGFADEKIGEGTELTYNGFNMGASFYIVYATGAGSTNVADGTKVTYDGNEYALEQDGATDSYLFEAGGDTLYYINNNTTANLDNTTYVASTADDAGNSMYIGKKKADGSYEETSGIVLNTAGVVLTLGSDLKEGITNGSGIKLNYSASIDLKDNVTLSQGHVSAKDGVYASITGSGTYDLGGTTRQAYSTGLDNPSKWTGTVVASGTADQMDAQYLGNTNSTLEFRGVSGTLLNTNNQELEYRMKIKLTDVPDTESETAKLAVDIISANGDKRLFSNEVSGSGNMKMSGASETAVQDITFSGDISGWTGAFEAGQGTVNLTLTGNATEVNAGIHKAGTSDILNISIDGSATRTFNKVVSGDNLTVTAGDGSTRVILKEGGNVVTSAVLTDNNAILEVRDAAFMVWNGAASFAANGSSGIDIADTSGIVQTTIRTNVPTVSSARTEGDSGATPLSSVCGTITNAVFRYDETKKKVTISKIELQSSARIENTIIDLKAGSTLELSNMVLADTVKITDDRATLISDNNVVELGSGNAKVGEAGKLNGATLKTTGTTEEARANVSGSVYTIDFTGIQNVNISSGTLTFNFDAYSAEVKGQTLSGSALFYELKQMYDYIAVQFVADGSEDSAAATMQYEDLTVQSQVTNEEGVVMTSTGYYNGNATSGAIVYFDSMALPEPTTSTLALMTLAALCARRRRQAA